MTTPTTLTSFNQVQNCLTKLSGSIGWMGKTHILCRGIEQYVRNFFIVPTAQTAIDLCMTIKLPFYSLEDLIVAPLEKPIRLLAFESSPRLDRLVVQHSWQVLLPERRVIHRVADKTILPSILQAAKVPIIPNIVTSIVSPEDAKQIWDMLKTDTLVVQESENNLTGRGTYLIKSLKELKVIFEKLEGHSLKVTQFIKGQTVTISGCVTKRAIFTSYLSKQLVGIPQLTDWWAAHCGNDFINNEDISTNTVDSIRIICESIGSELARFGFWGHFGLDIMVTPDGIPYVLEINPRIQSVSSLVHATEIENVVIPLQAIHILEGLGENVQIVPVKQKSNEFGCNYSQIIVAHKGLDQIVQHSMQSGTYSINNNKLLSLRVGADMLSLHDENEILVTPWVSQGEKIANGERLVVIQKRGRMTDGNGHLGQNIVNIVRLIRRNMFNKKKQNYN